MFNSAVTVNANNAEMFRRAMAEQYRLENFKSKVFGLWAFITRRPAKLLNLQAVADEKTVTNRHYVGLQTVAIDKIAGSENNTTAFDAQFHPVNSWNRQRWINVATAYGANIPLPPVALIQVGEAYFVRDGHHRISVARLFGRQFIEAEVTVWQTEPEVEPAPEQPKPICRPQPQPDYGQPVLRPAACACHCQ